MSVGSVPKRLSFDWSRPISSNLLEFRCIICGSVVVPGSLRAREGVVSLQFRVAEEPKPNGFDKALGTLRTSVITKNSSTVIVQECAT